MADTDQYVTYPARIVVLDDGTEFTAGYHISFKECASDGCTTTLCYCDHGRTDAQDPFTLPDCQCDEPPMLYHLHRRMDYRCACGAVAGE
jgi:hypothetical protein